MESTEQEGLRSALSATSAYGCVVVFCGLPGAGKTTLCNGVASRIRFYGCCLTGVVCFDALYHAHVEEVEDGSSDMPVAFDPALWRSSRDEGFSKFKSLLTEGHSGPSIVFLDDNMYLQSMRKHCYKLARDGKFGFVVVHVTSPFGDVLERNRNRKALEVVPEHVMERMAACFEDPVPGSHPWSTNVVSITNPFDADAQATIVAAVTNALRSYCAPPRLHDEGSSGGDGTLRHQLDVRLRAVVSARMHNVRNQGCSKTRLSELARDLSSSKAALLRAVKTFEEGGCVDDAISQCFRVDDVQCTLHFLVEYFNRSSPAVPDLHHSPFLMELGELTVTRDGQLNASWLGELLGCRVISAQIKGLEDQIGGMCGEFHEVDVRCEGGPVSLVLKTGQARWVQRDILLGTAREALFLSHFSPLLSGIVPKVYYTFGDMRSGAKAVLMERLPKAVPAGVFYGTGNPANWGLVDSLDAMCEGNPNAVTIAKMQFELYAKMHALFWRDRTLLSLSWLRATEWMQGREKLLWENTQRLAVDMWIEYKRRAAAGDVPLKMHPHTFAAIESSHTKISWDDYLTEANSRAWTLVHGDCHPNNALWVNQRTREARLYLIDFEMVGVGSPPQELGQFMISHVDPSLRVAHERELLEHYHASLIHHLREHGQHDSAESYSFEECWHEYLLGAAGRWLWFVPHLCSGTTLPDKMTQYFHDQLTAFLLDHFPDPKTVPMPRV